MEEFEEIRSLLARRATCAPGPEYLEKFLADFRERQRREAMSVPVWRLIWERSGTWLARGRLRRWFPWIALVFAAFAVVGVGWAVLGQSPEGGRAGAAATGDGGGRVSGFSEAAAEPATENLVGPAFVQIGWREDESGSWTPGFQVAEGVFVSASSEARLLQPVRVRKVDKSGGARIVMRDPHSGLVVIDAREGKAPSGRGGR